MSRTLTNQADVETIRQLHHQSVDDGVIGCVSHLPLAEARSRLQTLTERHVVLIERVNGKRGPRRRVWVRVEVDLLANDEEDDEEEGGHSDLEHRGDFAAAL